MYHFIHNFAVTGEMVRPLTSHSKHILLTHLLLLQEKMNIPTWLILPTCSPSVTPPSLPIFDALVFPRHITAFKNFVWRKIKLNFILLIRWLINQGKLHETNWAHRWLFLWTGTQPWIACAKEDAVRRNDLGTPHCAMRQCRMSGVTLAAAGVLGTGELWRGRRQSVHQHRESDTFVTMTADGHRWKQEGGEIIQC
jgi:hypothetical protein